MVHICFYDPNVIKKQADLQVPDIQGASHAAKMNEEILTDKTSFQMQCFKFAPECMGLCSTESSGMNLPNDLQNK